jgi:hypothetical protein
MRTSIAGAALLLAGAGAAGLAAAADTNGNGLALNGSDTLDDVTKNDVFSACATQFSDWTTNPLSYQGGGSRVGAGNMVQGLQAISPMSSELKNGEFCAVTKTVYTTPAVAAAPGLTAGLLVGLDGVSITANQVMSCSSSVANGFGSSTAMSILSGGNGAATGATYTFGDPAGTLYQNQPSFDALAVLYFGLTHDGNYSGCASDTRKTLIKNWKNLFSSDCAAGDTTCSAGITHAWRRSDLSGTTDAFVSILNPPNGNATNGKGAGVSVGIGSLPGFLAPPFGTASANAPGAAAKSNPFCNSLDANAASPAPMTAGGSADFSDQDPVRTTCVKGVDTTCEGFLAFGTTGGNNGGDHGVVLPILMPDSAVSTASDMFPQATNGTCSGLCMPFAAFKTNQQNKYAGFLCPNGSPPLGGNLCYMPVTASGDPRCVATNTDKCADVVGGKPDGRRYNLVTMVASTQVAKAFPAFSTGTFQFSVDATTPTPRILNGSFYRIHSVVPGANYAAGVGTETGTTGVCTQTDDTSQIGCLADSDPCSVGYAGREADQGFPGTVAANGPTSQPLKGLTIDGTPPFTPGADPDLAVKNLLVAGATPLYPLARRLWYATIYGFQNLQGHELELSQCYATNSIMSSAMTNNGFVPVPSGVSCIDYPETVATTATAAIAPNVQGSGPVALNGCASATNTDACINPLNNNASVLNDINGNPVPESQ